MNKRHIDPRRQKDALTNHGVVCLLLLLFFWIWIVWTQTIVDYNIEPNALSLESLQPNYTYSTISYYENWPWSTTNFSEFDEYNRFIGRSGKTVTFNSSFETHEFSVDISDRIEINRIVPDTRHILCKIRNKQFNQRIRSVGKTSVIITFYNEAASVLLRTITSILRNTPSEMLGEIVLIDDCSSVELNATFLQHFHSKINFRRNAQRLGVISSRNIGARLMARHKYIFFMESHCEVNVGWLEPLVQRLRHNPGMVVSPTLDVIDRHTFEYGMSDVGTYSLRAGFDWSLTPQWFSVVEEDHKYRRAGWNAPRSYSSPTAAGGLFGISRQWFVELGGFNKNLEMWGGESLELSLRVWMCGGHVEMVPCSRVGHIFRTKTPYELPFGETDTYTKNSITIAELWFSDYKRLFYEHSKTQAQRTNILKYDPSLRCHTFRWYLENVFQELVPWSNVYQSLGRLQQAGRCVERTTNTNILSDPQLSPCQRQSAEWLFLKNGQIVLESELGMCLRPIGRFVLIDNSCDELIEDHIWLRINNTLVHSVSEGCLDVMNDTLLVINDCNVRERATQIWHFTVNI